MGFTTRRRKRLIKQPIIRPKAKALIEEYGINTAFLVGTGKHGNILLADVQRYLASIEIDEEE